MQQELIAQESKKKKEPIAKSRDWLKIGKEVGLNALTIGFGGLMSGLAVAAGGYAFDRTVYGRKSGRVVQIHKVG